MHYTYSEQDIPKKKFPWKSILLAVLVLAASAAAIFWAMQEEIHRINTTAAESSAQLLEKSRSTAKDVEISGTLRKTTVKKVIDKESFPSYSNAQIRSLDVSKPSGASVSDLKLVTQGNLRGLEEAFWKAEQDYDVNCLFVMAIASHESANGTICFKPNNMFGFGNRGFSSKAECIDVVSRALANNYLRPGGGLYSGKTIASVNRRYAASTTWDDKVANNMTRYYSIISQHHNAALQKLK